MSNLNTRVINIRTLEEAKREIELIGPDQTGAALMAPKALHKVIKVQGLRPEAATIIKQELLARGGDAVTTRGVLNCTAPQSDILMMATVKQYKQAVKKLKMQPFGLKKLAEEIDNILDNTTREVKRETRCKKGVFHWGTRTYIMGILNVTPDSFSDGGRFYDLDHAIAQAKQMVAEGADIIDVGGESTRPGYTRISDQEEIERIAPILEVLVKEIEVPISVDTYKSQVAKAALEIGVDMVNDIWGLLEDPELAKVTAQYNAPLILMHNKQDTEYQSLMDEILASLRKSIALAQEAGVEAKNIIIDPGIGFGKDLEQNLKTMRHLEDFRTLGYPILLGTSRKSLIGKTLDLPAEERLEGTAATVALGIAKNAADIIRIHDVKQMVRVARMTDAMVR